MLYSMKFSIITPAWNAEQWFSEAIESVLNQEGDFEIEYIVVTDPSEDKTIEIAKKYAARITSKEYPIKCRGITMSVIENNSPKDAGMTRALNTGFNNATGDIHAWIPANDRYILGAFEEVAHVFAKKNDISWLIGINDIINEEGHVTHESDIFFYHRPWLINGIYGQEAYHVAQAACFWRAHLWKTAGPIDDEISYMPDYWLWIKFAEQTPLVATDIRASEFRKHQEQSTNASRRSLFIKKVGGKRSITAFIVKVFFYVRDRVAKTPLRKTLEALYPIIFPFQKPYYLHVTRDSITPRFMTSFLVKPEQS